MTRFAIDAAVALRIVRDGSDADHRHQLVGPSVLRSDVLAMLYQAVRAGQLDTATGRAQLEGLAGLKIRLLGDRVSRATAWRIAAQLDWGNIASAEYLAVAVLQADVLVTEDQHLREAATGLVPVAGYGDLASPA